MSEPSYRESHVGCGPEYHAAFSEQRDLVMMWQVERSQLDEIVARRLGTGFSHLDFACGTGRIIGHLADRAGASVGVDVSPTMLAQARGNAPTATLHQADLTADDVLGDQQFDLVTAFRFFPNAEPALRAQVIAVLVRHLAPGGVLLFNNHQNAGALRRRIVRTLGRNPGHEMTTEEVQQLVSEAGLQVARRHAVGLLPLSRRTFFLPIGLVAAFERRVARRPISHRFATSVLHECVHAAGVSA